MAPAVGPGDTAPARLSPGQPADPAERLGALRPPAWPLPALLSTRCPAASAAISKLRNLWQEVLGTGLDPSGHRVGRAQPGAQLLSRECYQWV